MHGNHAHPQPRWNIRRGVRYASWVLISSLVVTGSVACVLVCTTQGAWILLQGILRRHAASLTSSIQEIRGTLWDGIVLHQVTLTGLRIVSAQGTLQAEEIDFSPLRSWDRYQPTWTIRALQAHHTRWAEQISIERVHGSTLRGFVAEGIRSSGLKRLPMESRLEIQRVETDWPMTWAHLRNVDNGRVWLEQVDPIVFFITRHGQELEIKTSTNAVDIQEVLGLFPQWHTIAPLKGTINNLILMAKGAARQWTIVGNGQIAQASWKHMTVANSASKINVRIAGASLPPRIIGTVDVWGGTLLAKRTRITLQPSTITFTGDPLKPAFDCQGRSTVGRTVINIHLQGTKDEPRLELASQPPLAQETLLFMLATGKTWRATRETFAQGTVSTTLVTDVVDYLFFGGFGNRLARRFGISEFGLTQNVERNLVGAQATFGDRVMFDVLVDPTAVHHSSGQAAAGSSAPQQQLVPYQVGAEYQATEDTSIRVEGERSAAPSRTGTPSSLSESSTAPATDSTLLLKLKKQF